MPDVGWTELICGPMFSGKSEELIRRLRHAIITGERVQVFKPGIDKRYSVDEIVSHANARMRSEPVDSAREIVERLDEKTRVVGIDEANFFGPELAVAATRLGNKGQQVIIAGLDTDYLGRPFPPIPELLALAESITKLRAVCARCGAPAQRTQRLVQSEELILVGAVDCYEARCRKCFESGLSGRTSLTSSQQITASLHYTET